MLPGNRTEEHLAITYLSDGIGRSEGPGIYCRVFSATGVAETEEKCVYATDSKSAEHILKLDIAAIQDGKFVVTWLSSAQVGDLEDSEPSTTIFAQLVDLNAKPASNLLTVERALRYRDSEDLNSIKVASSGNYIAMIWETLVYPADSYNLSSQVYVKVYDKSLQDTPYTTKTRVGASTATQQRVPNIKGWTGMASGFSLTWIAPSLDQRSHDVYIQDFGVNNKPLPGRKIIKANNITPGSLYSPSLFLFHAKEYFSSWTGYSAAHAQYGLLGRRILIPASSSKPMDKVAVEEAPGYLLK
jgi:hypothetical protein